MSSFLEARGNSLQANPNVFRYPDSSDINITRRGAEFYWGITAIMAISALTIIGLSFRVHRSKRIFHYITAVICLVASIAYFTMASNLGYAAIAVEFQRSDAEVRGLYREVFYVRYIDWFVTTPLLLLDLLLTAGLPWPTVLYTIMIDLIMIVTGLVGALVASSYKWGYFVFSTVSLFIIAYQVVIVGRAHARAIGTSKVYTACGAWTIGLWFIYPIAWGLSEGGNIISPDSEAVFYGVLDFLAKPVFGALLLWGHRNIDPATLGLHIRDYDERPIGRSLAANKEAHGIDNGVTTGYNNGTTPATATAANTNINTTGTGTGTTGVTGTNPNTSSV
ncbi:bacteriorhodopsin [Phlyctema vagabunda]|uniref:Bacteriorhodopsin n=1 Tax=Phlyctema vagabunda TaxID=108571 RepID=A0ABR4P9P2_9HELO